MSGHFCCTYGEDHEGRLEHKHTLFVEITGLFSDVEKNTGSLRVELHALGVIAARPMQVDLKRRSNTGPRVFLTFLVSRGTAQIKQTSTYAPR